MVTSLNNCCDIADPNYYLISSVWSQTSNLIQSSSFYASFGFINGVDNLNWPPNRKAFVNTVRIKGADLKDEFLFQILAAFRRT